MAGLPQALRAAGSVLVQVLGWTPSFEPQRAFGLVEKSLGHCTGHIFSLSFSPFEASSVCFRVVACLFVHVPLTGKSAIFAPWMYLNNIMKDEKVLSGFTYMIIKTKYGSQVSKRKASNC